MVDSVGPVAGRLYARVEADQWMNIRLLMPAMVLYSAGAAFLIRRNPGFWIDQRWHLLLIGVQVAGFLIYPHLRRPLGTEHDLNDLSHPALEWQDEHWSNLKAEII